MLVSASAIAGSAREVTLGLIAPASQSDAVSLERGVQLAVDEANQSGGGLVRLEVKNSAGQWGTAGNDAVELVCERRVHAIITPSDGADSHLILQVSGRTRVPVASVCPDASVTGAGIPWALRVVPRTEEEAAALFAATRPDAPQHWWAVIPPGRSGRAIRHDLETAARATTTPIERFLECADPGRDIRPLAQAIASGNCDGVLVWLRPAPAAALVTALRDIGFRGRLAGPSVLNSPAFLAGVAAKGGGVLVTGFAEHPDRRARADAFARQYQLRYDAPPDFTAAAAHDAAIVLVELLRRSAPGRGADQFPSAASIAGVTGDVHFDAAGNRTAELQVLVCQQSRFVPMLREP